MVAFDFQETKWDQNEISKSTTKKSFLNLIFCSWLGLTGCWWPLVGSDNSSILWYVLMVTRTHGPCKTLIICLTLYWSRQLNLLRVTSCLMVTRFQLMFYVNLTTSLETSYFIAQNLVRYFSTIKQGRPPGKLRSPNQKLHGFECF